MEYDRLSAADKKCYDEILSKLKAFQLCFKLTPCYNPKRIPDIASRVVQDNPQLFWLSGGGEVNWATQNDKVVEITFTASLTKGISPSQIRSMNARFTAQVDAIVRRARQLSSAFEQALYIHDYLVDHTSYNDKAPYRYCAYGCLVNGSAVCAGYAKAFQLLMTGLGHECGYVTGSARTGRGDTHRSHAWNYVRLDGDYYFVDVTWDDPVMLNASLPAGAKFHVFFCVTSAELKNTHSISPDCFAPVCTAVKCNYYIHKGYYLARYTYSAFEQNARYQLAGGKTITVKFSSPAELDKAVDELIRRQRIFDLPGFGNEVSYKAHPEYNLLTVYRT